MNKCFSALMLLVKWAFGNKTFLFNTVVLRIRQNQLTQVCL